MYGKHNYNFWNKKFGSTYHIPMSVLMILTVKNQKLSIYVKFVHFCSDILDIINTKTRIRKNRNILSKNDCNPVHHLCDKCSSSYSVEKWDI